MQKIRMIETGAHPSGAERGGLQNGEGLDYRYQVLMLAREPANITKLPTVRQSEQWTK